MKIRFSRCLAFLLVWIFAAASVCPCIASADGAAGIGTQTSITLSDVITLSGTTGVTETEMSYFAETGLTLQFPAPSGNACVANAGKNGFTVCVTAEEYTCEDGKTVRFVPVSAGIGDVTHDFVLSDGLYTASFDGLEENTSYDIKLIYKVSAVIGEEQAAKLLSLPYFAGKEASDALVSYNDSLKTYNEKLAEYERITAPYAAEIEAYDAYLRKLKEYEDAVAGRELYEKALDDYDAVIASYASYAAALEEYRKNASESASRLAAKETAMSKLCVIESLFVKFNSGDSDDTSSVPSIYDRIMSSTVTEVLANKEDLILAGADEKDIINAAKSTESLRKYIGEYKNAKTDEEKFASYKKNYILIKTNFTKLYESLTALYENKLVRAELNTREKTVNYEQFLGQLAMICRGLDNKDAASPTSVTWDAAEESAASNDDGMPEKSDYVKRDVYSGFVVPVYKRDFIPEKPEPAAKPDVPDKNEYVGECPTLPVFTETVNKLISLVENGSLCETTDAEEIRFEFEYSASVSFSTLDYERGDMDGNGIVNAADAVYLLRHSLRAAAYPISQSGDLDRSNIDNAADAVYLLRHTLRASKYPIF